MKKKEIKRGGIVKNIKKKKIRGTKEIKKIRGTKGSAYIIYWFPDSELKIVTKLLIVKNKKKK